MPDRHIVIVGGGFTGTALAIQLARFGNAGLAVTVVEPRPELARGVAYATEDPAHRINVPADRMQLSAAEQGDFDRWYRASTAFGDDEAARWQDGRVYPQRAQFGRYVAERFSRLQQHSAVKLRHVCDRAIALEQGTVVTALGSRLAANEVVLAISHPPPTLPRALAQTLRGHTGLIADPWRAGALASIGSDETVAIMGSGLTMSDVVATLHRNGHRTPITAFSRRGLLPRPNISGQFSALALDYECPQQATALGWLRRVRSEVAHAGEQQLPWQLVLDDIRSNAQRIWQQLSLHEQKRFLRHLRPWWDVHRYRSAPQVSAVLERLTDSGQLRLQAARLQEAKTAGAQIDLLLQARHGQTQALRVDRLIVTTGPAHGELLQSDTLLRQLLTAGTLQADPLGLGILVNVHSQTIDHCGDANPHLYVAGPAARGRFGELMGLPQVAEHAENVARQLLGLETVPLVCRCRRAS